MAGSALLEREIEKYSSNTEAVVENSVTEEELRHRSRMSQIYRDNFGDNSVRNSAPAAPAATVVEEQPVSAPAPVNSAERLADYNRAMQNIRNLQDFAPVQDDSFAPVQEQVYDYAPYAGPETPSDEQHLYEQGILMSPTLASTTAAPSYAPTYFTPESETIDEDALPTPRTMATINTAEAVDSKTVGKVAAFSAKTKVVLASIAATVVLLLAVICVNTALIRNINAGVSMREETILELEETLSEIEGEIADLTTPENIENWAAEHGMTPPES